MMSDLTCKECGASFPRRTHGSGRQKTKCPDCEKPNTYRHECIICEEEFDSSRKNQKTCSPECYKAYDKAKTYAWRERNPERYRELCRKHNKASRDRKK